MRCQNKGMWCFYRVNTLEGNCQDRRHKVVKNIVTRILLSALTLSSYSKRRCWSGEKFKTFDWQCSVTPHLYGCRTTQELDQAHIAKRALCPGRVIKARWMAISLRIFGRLPCSISCHGRRVGYEYERLTSEYFDQKSWKTDRRIRRNRFDLALTFSKWLHTVSAGQRKRNRNSRSEAFTEPSWLWENAISWCCHKV